MSNFLVCLIVIGFFAVPCLILAISLGDTWKERLSGCIFICVLWLIFASGTAFGHDINAEKWNGGYCKCGTHWELKAASQHRTSHTKYYACPNCYAEIEIRN